MWRSEYPTLLPTSLLSSVYLSQGGRGAPKCDVFFSSSLRPLPASSSSSANRKPYTVEATKNTDYQRTSVEACRSPSQARFFIATPGKHSFHPHHFLMRSRQLLRYSLSPSFAISTALCSSVRTLYSTADADALAAFLDSEIPQDDVQVHHEVQKTKSTTAQEDCPTNGGTEEKTVQKMPNDRSPSTTTRTDGSICGSNWMGEHHDSSGSSRRHRSTPRDRTADEMDSSFPPLSDAECGEPHSVGLGALSVPSFLSSSSPFHHDGWKECTKDHCPIPQHPQDFGEPPQEAGIEKNEGIWQLFSSEALPSSVTSRPLSHSYSSSSPPSAGRRKESRWTPQQWCYRHLMKAIRGAYFNDRSKLFWGRHRVLVEMYKYSSLVPYDEPLSPEVSEDQTMQKDKFHNEGADWDEKMKTKETNKTEDEKEGETEERVKDEEEIPTRKEETNNAPSHEEGARISSSSPPPFPPLSSKVQLLVDIAEEIAKFMETYMKLDISRIVKHNEKMLTLSPREARRFRDDYFLAEKQHDSWCKQHIKRMLERRPPAPYPFT